MHGSMNIKHITLYLTEFSVVCGCFFSGLCWMIACLLYFSSVVDLLFSSLFGLRLLYFNLGDRVYVQHQFPSNISRCPPQNYLLIII
jgi:hypothetical protein